MFSVDGMHRAENSICLRNAQLCVCLLSYLQAILKKCPACWRGECAVKLELQCFYSQSQSSHSSRRISEFTLKEKGREERELPHKCNSNQYIFLIAASRHAAVRLHFLSVIQQKTPVPLRRGLSQRQQHVLLQLKSVLLDMGSRGDAGSFASEHCWLPRAVSKINKSVQCRKHNRSTC